MTSITFQTYNQGYKWLSKGPNLAEIKLLIKGNISQNYSSSPQSIQSLDILLPFMTAIVPPFNSNQKD